MELVISLEAEADIDQIANYTASHWGESQKIAVAAALRQCIDNIGLYPFNARKSDKDNVYVKKVARLPFVVVYIIRSDVVFVVNVLNDKQNR